MSRRRRTAHRVGGDVDGFIIFCAYRITEDWEQKDIKIMEAAGRRYTTASITTSSKESWRELSWFAAEFDQALEMKQRLCLIPKVMVFFREK